MANHARIRILVLFLAVLGALAALIWALSNRTRVDRAAAVVKSTTTENSPAADQRPSPSLSLPPVVAPDAAASPQPSTTPTEIIPQPSATAAQSPDALPHSTQLLIPVAGVRPEQLRDTFEEARSEGRKHDAIDIPAPQGTPVLAATDGRILKLFESKPGGTTIYQLGNDNRTVYYYAHLERYAEGIHEGRAVRRGEVIAYVGDTGNAGAGNYHLHFSILIVSDPKRYWDGTNINPYPLLRGSESK
ncbi:MAG TPA: peptidoglycan DD-metalloendopeptidase family protein [Pyrinomonadaceae bacterium]